MNNMFCDEVASIEDVIQKPKNISKFLLWMKPNRIYPKARNILYA